jgi:hypothetical protein
MSQHVVHWPQMAAILGLTPDEMHTTGAGLAMVFCTDKGVRYLADIGYNVVRHPYASLEPPTIVGTGRRRGEAEWLGELPSLIKDNDAPVPKPGPPVEAAAVNGKESSAIDFRLGAQLLSSFIGAFGAVLDVSARYTDARSIRFLFRDVEKLTVAPSAVDGYITAGRLNWSSALFGPYLEGQGRLFVVTEVLRAKTLKVLYERGRGVRASVRVSDLHGLVAPHVEAAADSEREHEITFSSKGPDPKYLAFGFKCFEIGFKDGKLQMVGTKPGGTYLDLTGDSEKDEAAILTTPGEPLLDLREVHEQ